MNVKNLKSRVLLWFSLVSFTVFLVFNLSFDYMYEYNINSKDALDAHTAIESLEDTLWVLEFVLFLVLIFLVSKVIDKILLPIKNITKIANEISVSDFSRSIMLPKDDDEIKALVDSFNEMIGRLKEGVAKIDRFNNDVSHELKTPLTVIKGEVEITLDKKREPDKYIKSMKIIDEEATQIRNIVDGLLLLSKYSKANIKKSYEICDIDMVLLKVLEKYNAKLEEKDISLHVNKLESMQINANRILLESVFSNLIDNAIKYTPKNKNIYISLFRDVNVHFIIRDEGIGIPEENIAKITDRFYRVDESRSKKIKGYGLGLSIVKNSVELHGWVLYIESKEGNGTTVRIKI